MALIPRLAEITPSFRGKVERIIEDLKGKGFDAVIGSGLRTPAQQAEKVKKGYSKTTKSFHLGGSDGLSRAADIVPRMEGWAASKRFWLMLGSSALSHGVGWGGLFGLDRGLKRFTRPETKAVIAAIKRLRKAGWPTISDDYKVIIGWDPSHVQEPSNWL